MVSLANRYNRVQNHSFNIDTKGFEFKKLSELATADGYGVVYRLDGFFVTKDRFAPSGKSMVFIVSSKNILVNTPSYIYDTMELAPNDDEFIEAVKAGKIGFRLYPFESKGGRKCVGLMLVDIE